MTPKTRQIYADIRGRLANGNLKVGERVSEQSLAAELNVSRTPVREAIKRLQADGYFDQVHRYGTVVRAPTMQEIVEVYDLREAIETHVIAHATTEQLAAIDDELAASCEGLEDIAVEFGGRPASADQPDLVQRLFDLDGRFHDAIVGTSDNGRFEQILGHTRLFQQIHSVRRHSIITFEIVMGIHRDHSDVLTQLRGGDMSAAADAMRRHIRSGKNGAVDWLRLQERMKYATTTTQNASSRR